MTCKRIQISICLSLLFLTGSVFAKDFNKVGTTGFVFLQFPVSARSMALGETGISLADANAEGLFINPALIALTEQKISASVTHANWYMETTHQAVGLTYNLAGIGVIGMQGVYFGFGEIERTRNPYPEEYGSYISMGTYTAGAYSLGISFARKLTNQFAFGASIKYVQETIDAWHASSYTVDIGFMYFTGFHSLRIAAFLQNFGLESKYVDEKFKMPQQLKMGISAEVYGNLQDPNYVTAILEAEHPNDINEHVQMGLEGVLLGTLILRTGYKLGYDDESFSMGLGLRFGLKGSQFRLDMGYMDHARLGATMRYSLVMEF